MLFLRDNIFCLSLLVLLLLLLLLFSLFILSCFYDDRFSKYLYVDDDVVGLDYNNNGDLNVFYFYYMLLLLLL